MQQQRGPKINSREISRVVRFSTFATKSARSGHPLAYSITTSATRHGSDVGALHAEPLNSVVLKSPTLNLRVVPSVREPCRPRTTDNATFTSSQPPRLPGYTCFFRWE